MFRPEKNQRALLEIAAGLPGDWDWRLWLAGEGPERAPCERSRRKPRARGAGPLPRLPGRSRPPVTGRPTSPSTPPGRRRSPTSSSRRRPTACRRSRAVRSASEECFIRGRTGWTSSRATAKDSGRLSRCLAADTPTSAPRGPRRPGHSRGGRSTPPGRWPPTSASSSRSSGSKGPRLARRSRSPERRPPRPPLEAGMHPPARRAPEQPEGVRPGRPARAATSS